MTPALRNAVCLLAHPLSLAAAGLIVVNDFVLRPVAPSWWTGKLSDAGALVIWPLLFAAALALILPHRWKHSPALAGGMALGLTLTGYLLLKLSPITNTILLALSGQRLRAVADPSDLLLLPILLLPAWLLFRDEIQAARPLRLRWEPLLAALVLLAGVADAAAPDYGIMCFTQEDGRIYGQTQYTSYASSDDGQSWVYSEQYPTERCDMREGGELLEFAAPENTQYRVTIGKKIEWKAADSAGWSEIPLPKPPSQAEERYRNQIETTNLDHLSGPLDAVIAPGSGDLLLAMGTDGVLAVSPSGAQTWVTVGDYRQAALREDGLLGFLTLLSFEFLLAFLVGVAWWNTATLSSDRTRWQVALVIIGWVLLALAVLMGHPDFVSGYFAAITMMVTLVAGLWLAFNSILRIIRVVRKKAGGLLLPLLGIPVIMILFILPYALWAWNVLPEYMLAVLVAGILVAAGGVPLAMVFGKKAL